MDMFYIGHTQWGDQATSWCLLVYFEPLNLFDLDDCTSMCWDDHMKQYASLAMSCWSRLKVSNLQMHQKYFAFDQLRRSHASRSQWYHVPLMINHIRLLLSGCPFRASPNPFLGPPPPLRFILVTWNKMKLLKVANEEQPLLNFLRYISTWCRKIKKKFCQSLRGFSLLL